MLPVYETASIDEQTGELIIKIVNSTASEANIDIKLDVKPKENMKLYTLGGKNKTAQNTVSNPEKLIPVSSELEAEEKFIYNAPEYSVTIMTIPIK